MDKLTVGRSLRIKYLSSSSIVINKWEISYVKTGLAINKNFWRHQGFAGVTKKLRTSTALNAGFDLSFCNH